jgi:hypothetical protein
MYAVNTYSMDSKLVPVCRLPQPNSFVFHKQAELMNKNSYLDKSTCKLSQRLFKAIAYACVLHTWTVIRFRVASFMQEQASFSLVNWSTKTSAHIMSCAEKRKRKFLAENIRQIGTNGLTASWQQPTVANRPDLTPLHEDL